MHRAIERELGVALAIAHRARLEKVPAAVNERREPDALAAVTCDLVRRDAEEDVVRARCFSSRGVRGGLAMGLDRALRGWDRVLDERRRRRRRRQRGRERRGGGCPRGGAYRGRRQAVAGESGGSRSASIFFFAFFFYLRTTCTVPSYLSIFVPEGTVQCYVYTCRPYVYPTTRYDRAGQSTFEGTFVLS